MAIRKTKRPLLGYAALAGLFTVALGGAIATFGAKGDDDCPS